jgi:hypothetical protein
LGVEQKTRVWKNGSACILRHKFFVLRVLFQFSEGMAGVNGKIFFIKIFRFFTKFLI